MFEHSSPTSPKVPVPPPDRSVDPFQDDDLRTPPKVPVDARLQRRAPKKYAVREIPLKYSSTPATVPPVRTSTVVKLSDNVEPEPVVAREPSELPAQPIQQVQHLTPIKRGPRNPLRDE
jgi:hypothetical protein